MIAANNTPHTDARANAVICLAQLARAGGRDHYAANKLINQMKQIFLVVTLLIVCTAQNAFAFTDGPRTFPEWVYGTAPALAMIAASCGPLLAALVIALRTRAKWITLISGAALLISVGGPFGLHLLRNFRALLPWMAYFVIINSLIISPVVGAFLLRSLGASRWPLAFVSLLVVVGLFAIRSM